MGYAFALGDCLVCNQPFTFNPLTVPSFRDKNNVRQPVCLHCMTVVNNMRIKKGIQPFDIPHNAYGMCDERELPEE